MSHAAESRPPNRLARSTSPYLLQHAHNPVHWYPWGDEAFERAREEGKPIFLSIGYSSCHWCHVMERESFENEEVAARLNRDFISIKVDREERPDLDEIYMTAVQLLTQHGGWPMSTWLTPDGRPFHGGTYYPPQQFMPLLDQIAALFRQRRDDVDARARQLTDYMAEIHAAQEPPDGPLSEAVVEGALDRLGVNFDESYGGFGRQPKFPPSTALPLLMDRYERDHAANSLRWITKSLEAMALGGIRDHLGGGFHRYSTDRIWLLPHFEKMLYDNAQLCRIYARAFSLTGRPDFRVVAEETCDWVLREMTASEGGFFSTLDADSDGEEGKFYVWTRFEVVDLLGADDADLFCRIYNVQDNGNFLDEATHRATGQNILHLTRPLADHAAEMGLLPELLSTRLGVMRLRLREVRDRRVWPALDDKVLAAWNGLMIGGLAECGRILDRQDYIDAAARAARFVLDSMRLGDRPLRSWRNGEASLTGYLEDHSAFCLALLDLHDATADPAWLDEARALEAVMERDFADHEHGGYFNTAEDHEELLFRTKSSYDQAMPSGNGMAGLALVRLYERTGERPYLEKAQRLLHAFLGLMQRHPSGTETLIRAAAKYLDLAPSAGLSEPDVEDPQSGVPVRASAELLATPLVRGGSTELRVTLVIAPGWHIASDDPGGESLKPTQIRIAADPGVAIGQVTGPAPTRLKMSSADETLSVYQGTVVWRIPISVADSSAPGTLHLDVFIDFQPCTETECQAPGTVRAQIPIEVLAD